MYCRGREEEQHDEDDHGRGELGDLAATARAVDHLRLRRAAVDDERARTARPRRWRTTRPTRSTFSSNARCTSRRTRETCGALSEDHDEDRRRRWGAGRHWLQPGARARRTSAGRRDLARGPRRRARRDPGRSSPRSRRSTAMNAPGIFGLIAFRTEDRRRGSTSETASVVRLVSRDLLERAPELRRACRPVPPGTPRIPASCPIATWMPTPVRNPMSTLRDRKSARKPEPDDAGAGAGTRAARIARSPASADVVRRPGRRQPDEPGGHDRGGRRVGADDEVPRRTRTPRTRRSGSGSCRGP